MTNNPKSLNQKHAQTNHQNNTNLSQQSIKLLNIIISPSATASEPLANTHLIKTRHNHTRQPGQQRFGTRYIEHKNTFIFWITLNTQRTIIISIYFKTQETNSDIDIILFSTQTKIIVFTPRYQILIIFA